MIKKLLEDTGIHKPTRDFTIDNHGTIFILIPHTAEAKAWVAESLSDERSEWGGGIVVEHRFIVDLAHAIRQCGLRVNT